MSVGVINMKLIEKHPVRWKSGLSVLKFVDISSIDFF